MAHGEAERRKQLAVERADVRALLAQGGPDIVFQPVVDLRTSSVVAMEALARFPGDAAPEHWFGRAHAVGLGLELELAALTNAYRIFVAARPLLVTGADALDGGLGVGLWMNASPAVVTAPEAAALLRSMTVPVTVEIIEHARIDDYDAMLAACDRLRPCGLRFAVDDVGAGYASMRHVLRLRPDVVKLDVSLVRGVHRDVAQGDVAAAVGTLARRLGADVVAEGVQDEAELDAVRTLGIERAQGSVFAEPGPLPVPVRLDRPPDGSSAGAAGDLTGHLTGRPTGDLGTAQLSAAITQLTAQASPVGTDEDAGHRPLEAFDDLPDLVVRFGPQLECRYANRSARRALRLVEPDPGAAFEELADAVRAAFRDGRPRRQEAVLATPDGDRHVDVWLIPEPGADGSPHTVVTFARDISHLRRAQDELRGLADSDPLTGLLNHAAFHAEAARLAGVQPSTDRDAGSGLALVLLDLDYLKYINDVHGHRAGDLALRRVAQALTGASAPAEPVARLGGDEFGWLVTGSDRDVVARRVAAAVAAIRAIDVPGVGRLSVSAGMAYLASTHEAADLFDRADAALYDAKASGRGVLVIGDDTDIGYRSRRGQTDARPEEAPPDLSSARTVNELARAALREWVYVLRASGGCLDVLDASGRVLAARGYYRFGHDDWVLAEETYRLDEYPSTESALRTGCPYSCRADDPAADPAEVALIRERGFASLLLTPLRAGDRALGVLELFDTRFRTFTADEQRVALSLAAHLSALLAPLLPDW